MGRKIKPIEIKLDAAFRRAAEVSRDWLGGEDEVLKRFDLFYVPIPPETASLDPEMVAEVHRGLDRDRYENQQGG